MKNCRRWRRRASNLKPEFKAKKGWLETHLWHSKRCKMIDYCGFKVAAHLNEKCLKSTYRASTSGVLLHDFSYWQPFWMDTIDLNKLTSIYGHENTLNITLEHENTQICPVKIIRNAFDKHLLFLHPAAVETGILEAQCFKEFLELLGISVSSASKDICTFKLHGPKSEQVLKDFFNLAEQSLNFPLKIEMTDPRLGKVETALKSSLSIDSQNQILSDDQINAAKSELFITDSVNIIKPEKIPIIVSKCNLEYFMICPKKWARVIWYNFIKIKPIKVAGIEQVDLIAFENENPVYPNDFVGSPAYKIHSESRKFQLETIHNRKPPAKRPNYANLGITSPFVAPFNELNCPLRKCVVEIEGKGIITERAEIFTDSMILIGYVTSATKASLNKGRSTAIASVNANFSNSETTLSVLVRNLCSPDTFRKATLKFIK